MNNSISDVDNPAQNFLSYLGLEGLFHDQVDFRREKVSCLEVGLRIRSATTNPAITEPTD